jgi:hypothetical protein
MDGYPDVRDDDKGDPFLFFPSWRYFLNFCLKFDYMYSGIEKYRTLTLSLERSLGVSIWIEFISSLEPLVGKAYQF